MRPYLSRFQSRPGNRYRQYTNLAGSSAGSCASTISIGASRTDSDHDCLVPVRPNTGYSGLNRVREKKVGGDIRLMLILVGITRILCQPGGQDGEETYHRRNGGLARIHLFTYYTRFQSPPGFCPRPDNRYRQYTGSTGSSSGSCASASCIGANRTDNDPGSCSGSTTGTQTNSPTGPGVPEATY